MFVCTTVLLESEWVLRSVYGFSSADVTSALVAFAGLPNVTLEDAALAAKALSWAARGIDFADALRLGKAQGCDAFVSFDRRFAKAAKALGGIEFRTL